MTSALIQPGPRNLAQSDSFWNNARVTGNSETPGPQTNKSQTSKNPEFCPIDGFEKVWGGKRHCIKILTVNRIIGIKFEIPLHLEFNFGVQLLEFNY